MVTINLMLYLQHTPHLYCLKSKNLCLENDFIDGSFLIVDSKGLKMIHTHGFMYSNNPKPIVTTLFRFITVFSETDNISQNIPHIQSEML